MSSRNASVQAMRGEQFSVVLSLFVIIGVVLGILTGVSIAIYGNVQNGNIAEANSQAERRDIFWQTFIGENDGQGLSEESALLASSLIEVLAIESEGTPEDISSSLLIPRNIEGLFVAPGLFSGAEKELGLDIFSGIANDSSSSSMICGDCGKIEESFKTEARLLYNTQDYTPTATTNTKVYESWKALPLTMGIGYLVGMLIGWPVGISSARDRERWCRWEPLAPGLKGTGGGYRLLAWACGLPLMIIQTVVASWKIKAAKKRAEREEARLAAEASERVEAELKNSPVRAELIRARENVQRLKALPQVAEVKEALKVARQVVSELEKMPAKFSATSAASIARSIREDSEDLLLKSNSLAQGHEEMTR